VIKISIPSSGGTVEEAATGTSQLFVRSVRRPAFDVCCKPQYNNNNNNNNKHTPADQLGV
jgi:hypothetical protein